MPEAPKNSSSNPIINLLNRLIRDVKIHREEKEQMKSARRSYYDMMKPGDWDLQSIMTRKSSRKKNKKFTVKLPAVP